MANIVIRLINKINIYLIRIIFKKIKKIIISNIVLYFIYKKFI